MTFQLFLVLLFIQLLNASKLSQFKLLFSQKVAQVSQQVLKTPSFPLLDTSIHFLFKRTEADFLKKLDRIWKLKAFKRNEGSKSLEWQLQNAWNQSAYRNIQRWAKNDLTAIALGLDAGSQKLSKRQSGSVLVRLASSGRSVSDEVTAQVLSKQGRSSSWFPFGRSKPEENIVKPPKVDENNEVKVDQEQVKPVTEEAQSWYSWATGMPYRLLYQNAGKPMKDYGGEFGYNFVTYSGKSFEKFLQSESLRETLDNFQASQIKSAIKNLKKASEENSLEEFFKSDTFKKSKGKMDEQIANFFQDLQTHSDTFLKQTSRQVQTELNTILKSKQVKLLMGLTFSFVALALISIVFSISQILFVL